MGSNQQFAAIYMNNRSVATESQSYVTFYTLMAGNVRWLGFHTYMNDTRNTTDYGLLGSKHMHFRIAIRRPYYPSVLLRFNLAPSFNGVRLH